MIKSVKGLLNKGNIGWLLAVMVVLCTSCNEGDKNNLPILTREQMVEVLTEIYLTEQKVSRLGLPRDSAEHMFQAFQKVVLKKMEVSDSVFKKSFDYYMARPKEMELIYTALVDSLSLMEQRIESSSKK